MATCLTVCFRGGVHGLTTVASVGGLGSGSGGVDHRFESVESRTTVSLGSSSPSDFPRRAKSVARRWAFSPIRHGRSSARSVVCLADWAISGGQLGHAPSASVIVHPRSNSNDQGLPQMMKPWPVR